jgi:photosystem II stability/assembly factor-like uncharacterized protein
MMKNYFFLAYLLLTTKVYAQWTPIDIPTKASFRALKSLGNHIWASGTQGTVGHSEDGGKSWQFQQIVGAEKLDFRDLAIQSAKEVMLMSAGPSEEGKASIWQTKDGGNTWKIIFEKKEPGYFFDCLQWDQKKQTGWLLADPINQKLTLFQLSTNQFTPIDSATAPLLQAKEAFFAASGSSLLVQDDKLVLVGGGGALARVYIREGKSTNWIFQETSIPTGEATGYFSVGAKNKRSYWAVGGDYRKLNERTMPILTTQDGGMHWEPLAKTPAFYMEKVIWAKPYWIVCGPSQSAAYHENKKIWRNLGSSSFHNIIHVGDVIWGIGAKGQLGKISLSSIDKLFLTEE